MTITCATNCKANANITWNKLENENNELLGIDIDNFYAVPV
jgi:hypothetical protein